MNRDGHNNVAFFTGPEVEHTPAFCKKTLFVVGKQTLEDIVKHANEHKATHIFMGANHSFQSVATYYWNETITTLLEKGFWVTLDYPAHMHENVLKILNTGIWQSRLFVPLLSVRIPNIETSSPNLTVKIDDVDFKSTNRGVWCMNVREVTDSNRFTDWNEYGLDNVIQTEETIPVVHVESVVKNDASLGLDPDSPSKLKPEPKEDIVPPIVAVITNPIDAAAAYADGTTQDPLSSKPATKKVSKK